MHDMIPHVKRIVIFDAGVRFVGYKRGMPLNICLLVFGPDELLKNLPGMKTPVYKCAFVKLGSAMLADAQKLSAMKSRYVLMNNVSQPLTDILTKHTKKGRMSILMPLRLENSIVRQHILKNPNAELHFINPPLKITAESQSLVTGSMMVVFNSKLNNLTDVTRNSYTTLTPDCTHDEKDCFVTLPKQ
jgi:hypothetical protein